jgi:hypothetical protein
MVNIVIPKLDFLVPVTLIQRYMGTIKIGCEVRTSFSLIFTEEKK